MCGKACRRWGWHDPPVVCCCCCCCCGRQRWGRPLLGLSLGLQVRAPLGQLGEAAANEGVVGDVHEVQGGQVGGDLLDGVCVKGQEGSQTGFRG